MYIAPSVTPSVHVCGLRYKNSAIIVISANITARCQQGPVHPLPLSLPHPLPPMPLPPPVMIAVLFFNLLILSALI